MRKFLFFIDLKLLSDVMISHFKTLPIWQYKKTNAFNLNLLTNSARRMFRQSLYWVIDL